MRCSCLFTTAIISKTHPLRKEEPCINRQKMASGAGFLSLFSVFIELWFGLCCSCVPGPQGSTATCACVAGYEGNGTHCKGETNTHTNTHAHLCGNSEWKLKRFLPVVRLPEVDPCSSSNGGCSEFAICTKLAPGERSCTCEEGYTGDGTVCLGRPSNSPSELRLSHSDCWSLGPKAHLGRFGPVQHLMCSRVVHNLYTPWLVMVLLVSLGLQK